MILNDKRIFVALPESLKNDSEMLFKKLGMTTSEAIRMFLNQSVLRGRIPFVIKIKEKEESFIKDKIIEKNFSYLWEIYPKREGGNSKIRALKALNLSIKSRVKFDSILDGVNRYLLYCNFKKIVGTRFVMCADRFIKEKHFENSWSFNSDVSKMTKEERIEHNRREIERAYNDR